MTVQFQSGVRPLLCTEHGSVQTDLDPDQIDRFIADSENLLWLDIDTSRTTDLDILKREFDFHELAIEDALRPSQLSDDQDARQPETRQQRPKIDNYANFSFLVFYSISAGAIPEIEARQIAFFIGPNYLVSVHGGRIDEFDDIAHRWQANIDKIDRTVSSLLYTLLDALVDSYFPVIDSVADCIDELEASIFERFDPDALAQIFSLKKSLLEMRRVVAPERDVLNVIIRRDTPLFGPASIVYFQDVYDHLVRVTDAIDIYRDLVSSALEAYLSLSSNQLNQAMRNLAGWTIPLMAAALLAGIWGMNFEQMPELNWRYGYVVALGSIALVFLVVAAYFRRRRWL